MVKKRSKPAKTKGSAMTHRRRKSGSVDEEERILREATRHLVFQHGMFLVATGLREARIKGFKVWFITVTLRYTTGHEGYIGDLLYDGEEFTFLTPPEVRKERALHIAGDRERLRKWHESQVATLPAGKR
jgi:hypothetical protein